MPHLLRWVWLGIDNSTILIFQGPPIVWLLRWLLLKTIDLDLSIIVEEEACIERPLEKLLRRPSETLSGCPSGRVCRKP